MNLDALLQKEIDRLDLPSSPSNLYDPIRYIMSLGGKRMRPKLVLLSAALYTDSPEKVINQALGIELFHNFTLLHDDIMDKAPKRRGQQTVHEKWDDNIAILSGDALFVKACQYMMRGEISNTSDIMGVFHKTALLVCEGQQMDMDFEESSDVEVKDYIEMIRLKTSVLLGAGLQIGGMAAGANESDQKLLWTFGEQLGLAFQIQDDYLDAFGDPDTFGKQVGGDILNAKKTYLTIRLKESIGENAYNALFSFDGEHRVKSVLEAYRRNGIDSETEGLVQKFTNQAIETLKALNCPNSKESIQALTHMLQARVS